MEKINLQNVLHATKTLLLSFRCYMLAANAQKTGLFDGNEDVGDPVKKGSATYNAENTGILHELWREKYVGQ
jgi:hypothetical protein